MLCGSSRGSPINPITGTLALTRQTPYCLLMLRTAYLKFDNYRHNVKSGYCVCLGASAALYVLLAESQEIILIHRIRPSFLRGPDQAKPSQAKLVSRQTGLIVSSTPPLSHETYLTRPAPPPNNTYSTLDFSSVEMNSSLGYTYLYPLDPWVWKESESFSVLLCYRLTLAKK